MSEASLRAVLDYLHAMAHRDEERIAACLDPCVVHHGVASHLRCDNRDQVLDNVRARFRTPPFGDRPRFEVIDAGARVIVELAGPRFRDAEWTPLQGQVFVVHTVRADRIVRTEDFLTLQEATAERG